MNMLLWTAWAAPAAPLAAAVLIGAHALQGAGRRGPATADPLLAGDAREVWPGRLAIGATLLSLLAVLAAILVAVTAALSGDGSIALAPPAGHWFGRIGLSLRLDGPGLAFALVCATAGFVAMGFSRTYLHREAGHDRFLAGLCLLLSGMQLIALGGNAALVFVGWELAGFASWLLIGYAWTRPVATAHARYAFVTNRIGDAGFLAALALCALWIGSLDWTDIHATRDPLTVRLVCLAFVLAALVKSAQWPFSSWIARALEGPTPSSALFYGALLVHAGAFLLIRIAPLLEQVPDVRLLIGLLGLATAFSAHGIARVQADIKSVLLFATLAQIGLIFLWCALGWTDFATLHLIAHAAWRTVQFLQAPSALELGVRTPASAPAASRLNAFLYSLSLHRFHLDATADATLIQPLNTLGSDARRLDDEVIGPVAGTPTPLAPPENEALEERTLIGSPGLIGRWLFSLADHLQTLESKLLLKPGESPLTRLLGQIGDYLAAIERLLAQPHYLLALIVLTFVVIL